MASDEMTTWISGAALVISLASFGLSFYVFTRNARLTTQQKKMELLTRMREAQIQYSELNRRYKRLCSLFRSIPPDVAEKLARYDKYEKDSGEYYKFAYSKRFRASELDEWQHHIDSMLLHIASDNRSIDEWEKKAQAAGEELKGSG